MRIRRRTSFPSHPPHYVGPFSPLGVGGVKKGGGEALANNYFCLLFFQAEDYLVLRPSLCVYSRAKCKGKKSDKSVESTSAISDGY